VSDELSGCFSHGVTISFALAHAGMAVERRPDGAGSSPICGRRARKKTTAAVIQGAGAVVSSPNPEVTGQTRKERSDIMSIAAIDSQNAILATSDHAGKATAALVLGILSVLGAAVPLLGVPLSIVGLVMASKGARSSRPGQARAGLVLSIIGLSLSAVVFVIGFVNGLNRA
jgi:hypothetical protein